MAKLMMSQNRRRQRFLLLVAAIAAISSFLISSESRMLEEERSIIENNDDGPSKLQDKTLRDLINLEERDSSSKNITTTYTDLIRSGVPLPKYTLKDVFDATNIYGSKFALLRYDPSTNKWTAYYNRKHQWEAGCMKLANAIEKLVKLLRKIFQGRFYHGTHPFVMAVYAGDYPDTSRLYNDCVRNNQDEPCDESLLTAAPVLHFGSVFRHAMFPNMIAMPMPGDHLNCFQLWNDRKRVCQAFLSSTNGGHLPVSNFDDGGDSSWDELIPQLIWRGTDFPYLKSQNNLQQPRYETYVTQRIRSRPNPKEAATAALKKDYHKLVPRWKGVVYTAQSEIEAARINSPLPKINIKFTSIAGGGKRIPTSIDGVYRGWKDVGFPVAGEFMTLQELAKYKYHIDLGGGGGTSWTATIQKLGMPGLLFHHVTPTKDYIHDYIKPWVHSVPVQSDLSDLLEKLEWAESHPIEAKQISDNGSNFVRELGTPDKFARLFEVNMIKPLQSIIDAYTTADNDWDNEAWNAISQGQSHYQNFFYPFMECTTSCQRMGKAVWGRNAG